MGYATHGSLDPPAIERLAQIGASMLVIVGDQDQPAMIAIADLVAAGIPHAQEAVIPGAAHMSDMEQPQEFNRLAVDFLASL